MFNRNKTAKIGKKENVRVTERSTGTQQWWESFCGSTSMKMKVEQATCLRGVVFLWWVVLV